MKHITLSYIHLTLTHILKFAPNTPKLFILYTVFVLFCTLSTEGECSDEPNAVYL